MVVKRKGNGKMAKLNKIVQLNAINNHKNVMSTIHTFLNRKEQDSKHTRTTYERAIRDFFRTMKNKELEQLLPEDLIFEKSEVEAYQVALKQQYKGATVNTSITAIRECYKKFEDNNFDVKSSWFDLECYDKHDSEKYGTLSHEEVVQIIDLISKTRKGKEKALLVRLAYATAFRKETLLTIKFNQLVNIEGQWYAKVLGKGNKWSHKKLSDDLYNSLMQFKKDENLKDDEKIFKLTHKTINKMMAYIRSNMNFGDRNIVFHSFKKASLNAVNQLSGGDLKAIQAQGDHSDVQTAMNYYIEDKKFDDLIIVDVNYELPIEAFDSLSHEQLLELVKGMDRNTTVKLLKKINAI